MSDILMSSMNYERCEGPAPDDFVMSTGIILKHKRDQHGQPVSYKAHLAAWSKLQSDEASYAELDTPLASIKPVGTLVTVATVYGWNIEHIDIKDAFLYSELAASDKVVVRFPRFDGFRASNGLVVRL